MFNEENIQHTSRAQEENHGRPDTEQRRSFSREAGGYLILVASAGILVLSVFIVFAAAFVSNDKVKDAAQLVFSAVLPLLGTWVGTILAFYYSKENFESASRSTIDLVRSVSQRLATIRIGDQMLRVDQIVKLSILASKKLGDIALTDMSAEFEKPGANGQKISRLIMVDPNGACVAIIHRSIWLEMLSQGAKQSPAVDPTKDNLDKLIGLPFPSRAGSTFEDYITKSIAFIDPNRTIADAKAAMESKAQCQDVIVTATGNANEPMLGWISNIDIARLSQA